MAKAKQINVNGEIISLENAMSKPKDFLKSISGLVNEKTLTPKKDETEAGVAKRLFLRLYNNNDFKVVVENTEESSKGSQLLTRTNDLAVDVLLRISDILMHDAHNADRGQLPTDLVKALKDLNGAAAKVIKITSVNILQKTEKIY